MIRFFFFSNTDVFYDVSLIAGDFISATVSVEYFLKVDVNLVRNCNKRRLM